MLTFSVNVEVVDLGSPEEEIRYLVLNNKQRDKTNEQKAKEAKVLKEVESKLAKDRLSTLGATGGRGNKKGVPNSAHGLEDGKQGKARDAVAKNVGFRSGRETERAIKAIDKIEELKEEGRTEEAELIRGALNNGRISSAEELARNIDIVEILCKLRKAIGNTRILCYSVKNIENTCILNRIITVGNGMICRTKHRTKLCKLTEKWTRKALIFMVFMK